MSFSAQKSSFRFRIDTSFRSSDVPPSASRRMRYFFQQLEIDHLDYVGHRRFDALEIQVRERK